MTLHQAIDLVLMLGGFVFAPSLIVSIVRRVRLPAATTLPTAVVLTVFVGCYVLLDLRLAAFSTSLTAVCWYILFFRSRRLR